MKQITLSEGEFKSLLDGVKHKERLNYKSLRST